MSFSTCLHWSQATAIPPVKTAGEFWYCWLKACPGRLAWPFASPPARDLGSTFVRLYPHHPSRLRQLSKPTTTRYRFHLRTRIDLVSPLALLMMFCESGWKCELRNSSYLYKVCSHVKTDPRSEMPCLDFLRIFRIRSAPKIGRFIIQTNIYFAH
jgi:hypothetical protein